VKLLIACAASGLLLSACGRKSVVAAAPKPAVISAFERGGLVDAVSGEPVARPVVEAPDWLFESPHFFHREGIRFASAVGSARVGDPALARVVAEDRARVQLLRLMEGGTAGGELEGDLPGARPVDAFISTRYGKVFVRVEVRALHSR
jgi:hypothetical protein